MKIGVTVAILAVTVLAGCVDFLNPEEPPVRPFVSAQFQNTTMAQVSAGIVSHCIEIGGKAYTPSVDGVGCKVSYAEITNRPPMLMAFGLERDREGVTAVGKMFILFPNIDHPAEMFGASVTDSLTEFLQAAGADDSNLAQP